MRGQKSFERTRAIIRGLIRSIYALVNFAEGRCNCMSINEDRSQVIRYLERTACRKITFMKAFSF